MNLRIVALLGAGVLTAATAGAHHGFGTFSMNEDIELTGVITSLDFVNPHSWLNFNVTGEDGTVVEYRCEIRSATTLRRSGWTPEMFEAGTRITSQVRSLIGHQPQRVAGLEGGHPHLGAVQQPVLDAGLVAPFEFLEEGAQQQHVAARGGHPGHPASGAVFFRCGMRGG
jgi:hypothetical protein